MEGETRLFDQRLELLFCRAERPSGLTSMAAKLTADMRSLLMKCQERLDATGDTRIVAEGADDLSACVAEAQLIDCPMQAPPLAGEKPLSSQRSQLIVTQPEEAGEVTRSAFRDDGLLRPFAFRTALGQSVVQEKLHEVEVFWQ